MESKSLISGYSAELSGGQKVYIADWLPSVALQNLTQAGKYIGIDNLLAISKLDEYSTHTAILAVTEATDPELTMDLIQHFVCTAAMDGDRIQKHSFDATFKDNLFLVIELFCHVVKSQYADFFALGLVAVQPQADSEPLQEI
jgi:hypothetical protein